MNKSEAIKIVQKYLNDTYSCVADELNQEGTIFTVNEQIKEPHIKIMAYKKCIVVNVSSDMYTLVKPLLCGKNRDEIFELPLVYGQTIHYVPDIELISEMKLSDKYSYELLQGEKINKLSNIRGFDNSLVFDDKGRTETKIVFVARKDDVVIGVAGACAVTEKMWEVGIDINPEYRNNGLGSILTRYLTQEILKMNILPFYSASVTNIGSQRVANRAGYFPCWIDTFGDVYDKNYAYNYEDIIKDAKKIVTLK